MHLTLKFLIWNLLGINIYYSVCHIGVDRNAVPCYAAELDSPCAFGSSHAPGSIYHQCTSVKHLGAPRTERECKERERERERMQGQVKWLTISAIHFGLYSTALPD